MSNYFATFSVVALPSNSVFPPFDSLDGDPYGDVSMGGLNLDDIELEWNDEICFIPHLVSCCSNVFFEQTYFIILLSCFITNAAFGVIMDVLSTVCRIRAVMNPAKLVSLFKLRPRIISRGPSSKMSIKAPSTIFLIGVLVRSLFLSAHYGLL